MSQIVGLRAACLAALLGACTTFVFAAPASALTFDFSFTNTTFVPPTYPNGVAGTVTGEIDGLLDNTSMQQATAVYIDSYPAGLLGLPAAPFELTLPVNTFDNRFSVSGGVLTFEYFFDQNEELALSPGAGIVYLQDPTTGQNVFASTATFTPVASATPLPAALPLFASGLAALGLLSRRRKRNAASAITVTR